jgi:hypothetical protein
MPDRSAALCIRSDGNADRNGERDRPPELRRNRDWPCTSEPRYAHPRIRGASARDSRAGPPPRRR